MTTSLNLANDRYSVRKFESGEVPQADIDKVKAFISRQDDKYRASFGRRVTPHPRQCIFIGTTNSENGYLRDITGNRRFWPVDVGENEARLSVFDDLPGQVDQIWAEAVMYWRLGEQLYLTGEAERLALEAQEEHREASGWEGMIMDYLEKEVPEDWDNMEIMDRKMYLQGNSKTDKPLRKMDRVCVQQIWVECLDGGTRNLRDYEGKRIGSIIARIPGWKRAKSTIRCGPYKITKGFKRT